MFDIDVAKKAKQHAKRAYPKESCGVVVGGVYKAVRNIASDPLTSFKISRSVVKKYGDDIQAIIHSHPDGNYYPSEADMSGQIASGVPWGIVHVSRGVARDPFYWGDGLPEKPLKGRVFQHGVTDCYSLIRDYFKQRRNIVLDEFPREWEWWLTPGFDLYESNFQEQNFRVVEPSEVKEGDCFLAQIRSKVINHAGVYVGRGLILHQLGDRSGYSESFPSCEQPINIWQKYIRCWVRYEESI